MVRWTQINVVTSGHFLEVQLAQTFSFRAEFLSDRVCV